jgi:DNA-binding FadR family transcriptional regulator
VNDRQTIQSEIDEAGLAAQLQGFVAAADQDGSRRLPPERELAQRLGVSRASLRSGLARLESEGRIWRHVGKGTFIGPKPPAELDVADLARRTNPVQVMRARFAVEPELASLAALNASTAEIAELQELNQACRAAATWRDYEGCDARFHHGIAYAAHNPVLVALLDALTAVRRAVTWQRPRPEGAKPPPTHHSFADHDRIADAIAHREPANAAAAMRSHLQNVEDRLIGRASG